MSIDKKGMVLYPIIFLVVGLNAWFYTTGEASVYYWDYKGYWSFWQSICERLNDGGLWEWFAAVRESILYNDYNFSSVAILTPFYYIVGPQRVSFIFGLAFLYISFLTVLLARFYYRLYDNNYYVMVLVVVMTIAFVPFWAPTVRGYPGIAGLIPVIGGIWYALQASFSIKIDIGRSLLLGFLLWLPFLLRRWYAYTIVSLYITLPILVFFYDSLRNKVEIGVARRLWNIAVSFLMAGLFSIVLVLSFQSELARRILESDYSTLYAAYDFGMDMDWKVVLSNVGYAFLVLVVLGILSGLRNPKRKSSYLVFFALANLFLSVLLFSLTQTPGLQHMIPFSFWMLLMAAVFLSNVLLWLESRLGKGLLITVVAVFAVVMLSASLYRQPGSFFFRLDALLPPKAYALTMRHMDSYRQLTDRLMQLTDQGEKVSVLGSSEFLNSDMLESVTDNRLASRIVRNAHVDERDGLMPEPFLSKYLVVPDRPQIHLRKRYQHVITIPAEQFIRNESIAHAYERLPESYSLGNNAKAFIYVKQRPFTEAEIDAFLQEFLTVYPDWAERLSMVRASLLQH